MEESKQTEVINEENISEEIKTEEAKTETVNSEAVKSTEPELPIGLKIVSWLWMFSGGIAAVTLIFLIMEAMSYGSLYVFGLVLGLLTCVIKIGPILCIYKRTPKMYDNLKIFFWLNVALLVVNTIMSFKVKALFSVFLVFWFWSDYKNPRTKQYFGI